MILERHHELSIIDMALLTGTPLIERLMENRLRLSFESFFERTEFRRVILPWIRNRTTGPYFFDESEDKIPGYVTLYFSTASDIVDFKLRFSAGL